MKIQKIGILYTFMLFKKWISEKFNLTKEYDMIVTTSEKLQDLFVQVLLGVALSMEIRIPFSSYLRIL